MPSVVETGISGFGGAVNAPGNEGQSQWTYFGPTTNSTVSHLINVNETPIVIQAFHLTAGDPGDIISIYMSTFSSTNVETTEALVIKNKAVTLTPTNKKIVLDMSGLYRLVLNNEQSLGTVLVVGHPSALSYWSYGLATFVL